MSKLKFIPVTMERYNELIAKGEIDETALYEILDEKIKYDVCIGSLGEQKVYLNWQDVKDICTKEVSKAFEQTKGENIQLKDLLKDCLEVLTMVAGETRDFPRMVDECIDKINHVLGDPE